MKKVDTKSEHIISHNTTEPHTGIVNDNAYDELNKGGGNSTGYTTMPRTLHDAQGPKGPGAETSMSDELFWDQRII